MYGTIQLSEVIFGMHIISLSNSKNSLVSVNKPNLQKTSKSAVLDLSNLPFWIFIRSNLKNYIN